MRAVIVLLLLAFVACALAVPTKFNVEYWKGKRALFISAHPDDIEAFTGGLVAQLTAQGTECFYIIVTNGDKGCGNAFCQLWTAERIAEERAKEAVNAAAVLGVPATNVIMLGYEDGMVTSYPESEIRYKLIREIRKIKPHLVMSFYPTPRWELTPLNLWFDLGYHPDHQATGKIAFDSHFGSQFDRLYTDAGPAWTSEQWYFWEFLEPTHYLDITPVMQKKVDAFCQHKTQVISCEVFKVGLELVGERVSNVTKTGVKYAEGFRYYF